MTEGSRNEGVGAVCSVETERRAQPERCMQILFAGRVNSPLFANTLIIC